MQGIGVGTKEATTVDEGGRDWFTPAVAAICRRCCKPFVFAPDQVPAVCPTCSRFTDRRRLMPTDVS